MQCEFFGGLAGNFSVNNHLGWTVGKTLANRAGPALVVLSDRSDCVFFGYLAAKSVLTTVISGSQVVRTRRPLFLLKVNRCVAQPACCYKLLKINIALNAR